MTEATNFKFQYNDLQGVQQDIPLSTGDTIFVLGANGSGKSSLIHKLYTQNQENARRISAHRQTWFISNALDFTPASKQSTAKSLAANELAIHSRWRDDTGSQKTQLIIFDLINDENVRAREIARAIDAGDTTRAVDYAFNHERPIQILNELLCSSNIPITISVKSDEQVIASKNGGEPYSIAELSDGERNALLITSEILTANPNTLFLIDEPERHLHRSIISPLLLSLFQKRLDCAFVIATHDIGLPLDNPKSSVLVVRECVWSGKNPSAWDTDRISSTDVIDDNIKRDILGSRRTILFVEGTDSSLDIQIYNILFPNTSIIPSGGCTEVQRSVHGITATDSLHWVNAFGLIDLDDRQPDEINQLKDQKIYALSCHSVESLYYSTYMIKKIAGKHAETTGCNVQDYVNKALQDAKVEILREKDNLCARLCQKRTESQINPPGWRDILQERNWSQTIDLASAYNTERTTFDTHIANNNLEELIKRYPIKFTNVRNIIAQALEFPNRFVYENSVRKLLYNDEEVRNHTRALLGELATAILSEDSTDTECL